MSIDPAIDANAKRPLTPAGRPPHTIRMADGDNVAIVANEGGLAAGTVLPSGLRLIERVPQGHKVALVPIGAGAAVVRYGIPIGYAAEPIAAGRWVH
jgi:galactarate dehydratase